MPKRKKRPFFGRTLKEAKQVRLEADPSNTNQLCPVWKVIFFDADGPWGKSQISEEYLWSHIFPKMRNYESMTWAEIEQNKQHNHSVPIAHLVKEARQRLEECKQDDIDALFRFRLSGEQRLWGIRDRNVFKILWWDPHHEICPSQLKHT